MITFPYAGHLDLLDPPVTVQSICATSYEAKELIEFKRLLTSILLDVIQKGEISRELIIESKGSGLDVDIT